MAPPVRIVLGVVCIVFAAVTALAMLGFTGDQMGTAAPSDRNLMGSFGAMVANALLYTAGLAAFILPLALGWGGWAMVLDRDPRRASRRATGVALLIPALAGLIHAIPFDPNGPLLVRWGHTELGGLGGALGHLMFGAATHEADLPVGFLRQGLDVWGGALVLATVMIGAFWLLDLGFLRLSRLAWTRWIMPPRRQVTTSVFTPFVPTGPAAKSQRTTTAGDFEAIAAGSPAATTTPAETPIPPDADDLLRRIRAKREEAQLAQHAPLPATTTNVVLPPGAALALGQPPNPEALGAVDGAAAALANVSRGPAAGLLAPENFAAGAAAPGAVLSSAAPASAQPPHLSPPAQQAPQSVQSAAKTSARPDTEYTPGGYILPSKDLLDRSLVKREAEHEAEKSQTAKAIEDVFANFSISIQVVGASRGPVVTQYEITLLDQAMRVNKVEGFEKDLAMKLGTEGIRIVAPLPNKTTIGIEVPNRVKQAVTMREVVEEIDPSTMALPVIIGRDVVGKPLVGDLAKMPHLLVAGATGMGKSVCMNAMICSILLFRTPEECKFIMIDPKMVELAGYEDIPHLLTPPITDMTKAHAALEWACRTMDERYEALRLSGVRNIADFNAIGETELRFRLAKRELKLEDLPVGAFMPYIVVLVDEYADLMMVNKEVEKSIVRLCAKSRACGIHVILTTQRPSADVVTGLIKSNLPSRICFRVVDKNNSRVVLDVSGAENLLGKGDLLFLMPGTSLPLRGQGVWLKDSEINAIVEHAKGQGRPRYDVEIVNVGAVAQDDGDNEDGDSGPDLPGGAGASRTPARNGNSAANGSDWISDRLFHEAVQAMYRYDRTGADFFRRKCNVGYNKATSFVERLEDLGFVSPAKGSAPRKILKSWDDWIDLLRAQGHSWAEGDDAYTSPFPMSG